MGPAKPARCLWGARRRRREPPLTCPLPVHAPLPSLPAPPAATCSCLRTCGRVSQTWWVPLCAAQRGTRLCAGVGGTAPGALLLLSAAAAVLLAHRRLHAFRCCCCSCAPDAASATPTLRPSSDRAWLGCWLAAPAPRRLGPTCMQASSVGSAACSRRRRRRALGADLAVAPLSLCGTAPAAPPPLLVTACVSDGWRLPPPAPRLSLQHRSS